MAPTTTTAATANPPVSHLPVRPGAVLRSLGSGGGGKGGGALFLEDLIRKTKEKSTTKYLSCRIACDAHVTSTTRKCLTYYYYFVFISF